MAHIQPDILPNVLPGEVHKTLRSLKSLSNDFWVWCHLAPWEAEAPDFLIISTDGRVLLVKVSTSAATQATNAAQLILLDDNQAPLGKAEGQAICGFLEALQIPDTAPFETLVVYPNIPHKQVIESRLVRQPGEPQWVGREVLRDDGEMKWDDFLPTAPMETVWIERLRERFLPEIVIHPAMTVRSPIQRRLEAGLTNYLLDYSQEAAVKADLDLGLDGEALSNDFRLNIINGVAGSGKTLILLYRLRLLHRLYPQKRFLVLTHNRPLQKDMESRFIRLEGRRPEQIEWRTFNAWCKQNWIRQPAWVRPLSIQNRAYMMRTAWEKALPDSRITERMLHSEIDWIKDQLPITKQDYLDADRRGRGFRLTLDQREQLWNAYAVYQQMLEQNNSLDWGDVPQHLWQFSGEGKVQLPQYDVVMIDEAQFFAPIWIALIRKAMVPNNAHLFMVADPTQGFLGRRGTWKSLGLEARRHTHALKRSYRTTREIMQFATLFYRARITTETDDDVLAPDMINMPNGVFPQIISLDQVQDEIPRVANEVADFVKKGFPRKDLLILHANFEGQKSLIQAVNHRLGKDAALDPRENYPGNYVRVTTLNAGAGIESPIVFLVGLRQLFEEEQSLRLSDEEKEDLTQENTRKIFMAATRAGQRLVLTYVGDLPNVMKRVLPLESLNQV